MSTVTPQRPMIPRPMAPHRPAPNMPGFAANIDPIRVLRRHVGWISLSILVGLMVGVVAYILLQRFYPLYAAEAIFEIQPGVSESGDVGTREITSDQLAARLANTETVLILNPTILRNALRNPDIRRTQWYRSFVEVNPDGRETFLIDEAVDELTETLRPSVIRGTNFFRVGWRTHRREDVSVVLNSVANAYLERRREINHQEWNENRRLFDAERNQTLQRLADLEAEIGAFIRSHGITSLSDPRFSQVAIGAQQLTEQIGELISQLNLAEGMLTQTAAKLVGTVEPTPEDIQEAEFDPQVARLLSQVTQYRTELRSSRDRLNPQHPQVVNLEARLRASEDEYYATRDDIIKRNLEGEHSRLRKQIQNLRESLEKLEAEAEEKDKVLRELAASQAQYQALEARRERLEVQLENEANVIREIDLIRARVDANRVRLAQQAEQPREMAFPRPHIIIPLGVLLVSGLTVGVIFLRELTDQSIKSASDLSVVPNARVLGVIPDLDDDPTGSTAAENVVRQHPRSVLAESYRQAATSILRAADRNGHQTVLFMGGLPGAGTTTSITNVAASLAASGKSVLVVDANFRRSRLARAMGATPDQTGLGDLLVGEAQIDQAIQRSDHGVDVICAGTPGNRVFERLNNGLFENIIAELRGRYDLVLFDSPPAVVAGDAMVLANRVDAAVLVVRAHHEQRGLVARLLHQLSDARCEGLGILLNRPRGTAGGYFKKNYEAMASYASDK